MLKPRIKIVIAEYETNTGQRFIQNDAAARLKITPQYLSAIIQGKKKSVNPEILFKLARLLGCKVDDLYIYEEE